MFLNRIYYVVKPILPRSLSVAMRRWRAERRRISYADCWPIDEAAGATPPNWPGWPGGKKFAVVLTHDVEGTKGLQRVESLMRLEAKHGYRSSFNFVPEREYHLSEVLRQKLEDEGFEVGVHGLKHDGKLYASKSVFASKAFRIKEYLRQWRACGFRSPLMQHRLGWLHQLEVEYDSSTFDTDPFEPQPDAAGTIYPFWVPGLAGAGYVELPYTLVQDFTLFVILRERNIDIWKQKLEWISAHGGMVLLNTHPDYMCFEGSPGPEEFPVSYYDEFLSHLKEKYEGTFWTGLPREVGRFFCSQIPMSARNTRKKICMVAYTEYESDNRVRRYAEALARRGDHVDVIALSSGTIPLGVVKISGVQVHRIQRRSFNERSMLTYAWNLLRFLMSASLLLLRLQRRLCYDLIHVHNMPDFLVFSAWYPKRTGAKVILDIHDIVPEFFASKFRSGEKSILVYLLKSIEKLSAKFSDHVIVSNHLWHQKLISRSISKEKSSVFVNNVDPSLFYRRARTRDDGKFIIIFPGSFQWHQGLDIAIEALAHLKDKLPNAELHLYGGGNRNLETELVQLVTRLGLSEKVRFFKPVAFDKIAEVIANADLGVVPKRADSFGNEAYSTKIMEFMSQGLPVVVSRTKIDEFYFKEKEVRFFKSGDSRSLAEEILDLARNQDLREKLAANGLAYASRHGWESKKMDYLDLVDSLTTENFSGINMVVSPTGENGLGRVI